MHQRKRSRATVLVAATLLFFASGPLAHGFVLADPMADKDAIASRADIAAQSGKFVSCERKAMDTCQRDQNPALQSCALTGSLTEPTTRFTGTDPKVKGIAAKVRPAAPT